ncbi:thioredoxin family protein [Streptomyces sp. NPDC018059]|uniref:thioredoxin family protein n=1 Tax=Streptomyces sp. NPDC018059 TaxID=3365041 RepID=UPI00379C1B4F
MAVIGMTSTEQFEKLLRENAKVVVMFMTTWNGPCKVFSPEFKRLSEQYADIVFASVDVDKCSLGCEVQHQSLAHLRLPQGRR